MMKLSKETINLLKNFSTINGNLLIKPGKTLSTLSAKKSVYASADVTEEFETEFGIYDLNEFLAALSLFDAPDLIFGTDHVVIKEGRNSIKYYSADPAILIAPTKQIKVPPPDIEFNITAGQMAMVLKTSGVLKGQDVNIVGEGGKIKVVVGDNKNSLGSTYQLDLGDTDSVFTAHINVDNLKLMPNDYKVELSAKKVACFTANEVKYVVTLEADSTFED